MSKPRHAYPLVQRVVAVVPYAGEGLTSVEAAQRLPDVRLEAVASKLSEARRAGLVYVVGKRRCAGAIRPLLVYLRLAKLAPADAAPKYAPHVQEWICKGFWKPVLSAEAQP